MLDVLSIASSVSIKTESQAVFTFLKPQLFPHHISFELFVLAGYCMFIIDSVYDPVEKMIHPLPSKAKKVAVGA